MMIQDQIRVGNEVQFIHVNPSEHWLAPYAGRIGEVVKSAKGGRYTIQLFPSYIGDKDIPLLMVGRDHLQLAGR